MTAENKDQRPDLAARTEWEKLHVPGQPRPGFVLIVREDPQQWTQLHLAGGGTTKGGRELMAEARVLAVGEGIYHNCGQKIEAGVKRGDRVLTQGYNQFATHKVTPWSDTIYEFIPFNQIAAVLEEPPEVDAKGGDDEDLADKFKDEEPKLRPIVEGS